MSTKNLSQPPFDRKHFNLNLFRTMTVSLAMMFGRSGALIGNLLFPWLMSLGCLPPFSMIGATMLGEFEKLFRFAFKLLFFISLQFNLLHGSNDDKKSSSINVADAEVLSDVIVMILILNLYKNFCDSHLIELKDSKLIH